MFPSIRSAPLSVVILAVLASSATAQRGSGPRPSAPASDSPRAAAVSVVSVVAVHANGDSIVGDGVVVGESNRVVTELTMLLGASRILVHEARGTPMPATIIASDTLSGIAILQAPGLAATPVTLATRGPARNDAVVVMMLAPETDSAVVALRSKVTLVETFGDGRSLARLSETIEQDRSGAPVMNSAGELTGIAFVSDAGGANHTFVILSKSIDRLSMSLAASLTSPRPAARVATGQRPAPATPTPTPTPSQAGKPIVTTQTAGATSLAAPTNTGRPFGASGLRGEKDYVHIYAGEFARVSAKRESMEFAIVFQAYIEACSSNCRAMLGDSAIQQTRVVCDDPQSRSVYNPFTKFWEQQQYCGHYATEGTGVFAKPSMARAKEHVGPQTVGSVIDVMAGSVSSGPNIFGGTMALAEKVEAMRKDLDALVRTNGCGTPALNRFEENLRRYAMDEAPIALAAGETYTRPVEVTIVSADYSRLLDDLIAKNAAHWMINRYNPGSVRSVRVESRDDQGRPAMVSAEYMFHSTADNGYAGSVRLAFADGVPSCMYFYDAPTNCRTPDEGVIAVYRNGGYAR